MANGGWQARDNYKSNYLDSCRNVADVLHDDGSHRIGAWLFTLL